jgi:hypothetical protein
MVATVVGVLCKEKDRYRSVVSVLWPLRRSADCRIQKKVETQPQLVYFHATTFYKSHGQDFDCQNQPTITPVHFFEDGWPSHSYPADHWFPLVAAYALG